MSSAKGSKSHTLQNILSRNLFLPDLNSMEVQNKEALENKSAEVAFKNFLKRNLKRQLLSEIQRC